MNIALGKKPARHDDRTLQLATYQGPIAQWPVTRHWDKAVKHWDVLGNDEYGDCVQAGAYHHMQSWLTNDGITVLPSTGDVLKAYTEITGFNPDNPDTDQGTNMLDALNFWRRRGMPWTVQGTTMRHKIDGYAKLNANDHAEVKLGIAEFGGVYVGADMPLDARTQLSQRRVWTASRGPGSVAGSWGGHAMSAIGYTSTHVYLVTWGQVQSATWAWWSKYVDEAYAVLTTDWTGPDQSAPSGVDFDRLRHDIASLA